MAERTTVYLPGGLLQRARERDLNLSGIAADAIRRELAAVDECEHTNVSVHCEDCGARLEPFDEEFGDEPAPAAEPADDEPQ